MSGSGLVADAFGPVLLSLLGDGHAPREWSRKIVLTHDASEGTLGVLVGADGTLSIAVGYRDKADDGSLGEEQSDALRELLRPSRGAGTEAVRS